MQECFGKYMVPMVGIRIRLTWTMANYARIILHEKLIFFNIKVYHNRNSFTTLISIHSVLGGHRFDVKVKRLEAEAICHRPPFKDFFYKS